MKLQLAILASTLVCHAAATRNLKRDHGYSNKSYKGKSSKASGSNNAISYSADLQDYGTFLMSIHPNGTVTYDISLKNLDWVTTPSLSWHLHSGKIGSGASDASSGPAVACGANYTAGHYDPMLKCGSASTAPSCDDDPDVPCCYVKPATDYCANANIGTCEVGDLSGLHGKISVIDNEGSISATGLCPDCVSHYMPEATATDGSAVYNTWASIVFHGSKDSAGERVLCADIELV